MYHKTVKKLHFYKIIKYSKINFTYSKELPVLLMLDLFQGTGPRNRPAINLKLKENYGIR